MSEPKFDLYLSLMSKFLRLSSSQKSDIAEELRVHLEDRLTEFMAQGQSREEAIRLALDEFGDAGALAWQFTLPHSLRRRRQIMRYSIGSFVALAGIFTLVSLTWPNRPDAPPAVGTVVAQGEPAPTVVGLQAATEANDQTMKERREIEEKLSSREHGFDFIETTLNDALQTLGQQVELPIVHSVADWENIGANHLVTLQTPKGALSIRSALELMLRMNGIQDLTYSIRDGVILISNSNEDYEVHVYDCRDLLAGVQVQGMIQAGGMMGGQGGGFFSVPAELVGAAITQFGEAGSMPAGVADRARQAHADGTHHAAAATSMAGASLMGVLQSATQPARWINNDGEGGSMSEFDGVIVVRHHQAVHRKIEDVLAKLRKVKRGLQVTVLPKSEHVEALNIPPGKRLVTLNANWQLPVNSLRSGSRVDVVRFPTNREHEPEVVLANAKIVLPNISPMGMGFNAPTTWQVNTLSLIVTPEEAMDLLKTESITPHPLKFVLRGEDEDDEDEIHGEQAMEREDQDEEEKPENFRGSSSTKP